MIVQLLLSHALVCQQVQSMQQEVDAHEQEVQLLPSHISRAPFCLPGTGASYYWRGTRLSPFQFGMIVQLLLSRAIVCQQVQSREQEVDAREQEVQLLPSHISRAPFCLPRTTRVVPGYPHSSLG